MTHTWVDKIEDCLPQTQCTRCSYPCCHDYALALSEGAAEINQCPPGGVVTINKLARLLDRPVLPLDPEFGKYLPKSLAFIHEELCIGCVLCIQACPVDAIVGANKLMHTVIQSHCTGCELCLPVCPTDCIDMLTAPRVTGEATSDWPGYSEKEIRLGKRRYQKREQRLVNKAKEKQKPGTGSTDKLDRQQAILEAVRRKQNAKKR